ncbi:thioredoxin-disulfide reductase [Candidatus Woesearchaeota archaeon]|nr:thioredoxin-disulfide reductase [Candidatus Woesearchaeota archaeon]MCF7901040.1 thioredoxin-disulfide reductase [Candidatus Woesearchaeota archaeon]MCF8013379.1 thioredoxin-disulfide reductase [Candidatus Woesearchaeota archaeon]
MENVLILGTGIAGETAAIYTARANLNPLVITGAEDGGQLTLTTEVDNFPGFPEGISGPILTQNAKKQAERFGARHKFGLATEFNKIENGFEVTIDSGEKIQTKTLIIATGASARWLGLDSEQKFKGKGVSTCATCDGAFYKGKEVVVVGGGDSAMEEANFLTKFADKVTVIHRRDELRASKIMQDKFFKNDKTNIIWDSEIVEVLGDNSGVTGVKILNKKTNEESEFSTHGVFLAVGHIPNTDIFKNKLDMDDHGYLKVNEKNETNIKGVFAAGDVHDTRYRQAITAAGSGCRSAIEVEKYLESLE